MASIQMMQLRQPLAAYRLYMGIPRLVHLRVSSPIQRLSLKAADHGANVCLQWRPGHTTELRSNVCLMTVTAMMPRARISSSTSRRSEHQTADGHDSEHTDAVSPTHLYSGHKDTIFALSTPPGKSALAVIRITGSLALAAVAQLCAHPHTRTRTMPAPRTAAVRTLRHPGTGDILDTAVVTLFPAPHSYTGEDGAELSVHGSIATVSAVTAALASLPGLRPAARGEFTRRAFVNGKLDLTAVEGLADLLNADTDVQRRAALRASSGHLSAACERWRQELTHALAHVEAVIDFGEDEEDCHDGVYTVAAKAAGAVADEMRTHLRDAARSSVVMSGAVVGIVGPPNAGKSSLLNALAKRPAAIVSPIAGTTRDIVDVCMDMDGVRVSVCDTAGIRDDVADVVEEEGVKRAQSKATEAHVRVLVFDIRTWPDALLHSHTLTRVLRGGDGTAAPTPTPCIVVLNKIDTVSPEHASRLSDLRVLPEDMRPRVTGVCALSCTTGDGLAAFTDALRGAVTKLAWSDDAGNPTETLPLLTRERHRGHIRACVLALERFTAHTETGRADVAAEELRIAVREIAHITGRVAMQELFDIIFTDFCIGK